MAAVILVACILLFVDALVADLADIPLTVTLNKLIVIQSSTVLICMTQEINKVIFEVNLCLGMCCIDYIDLEAVAQVGRNLLRKHAAFQKTDSILTAFINHEAVAVLGMNINVEGFGNSFPVMYIQVVEILSQKVSNFLNMPLFIRTSLQDDFLSPGLSVEDCIAFCKLAKEAGVDVLDLSRGNMATAANKFEVPPVDMTRGFNLELAARFKEETGMIVIGVGRINDPYVAEKALEKVDMVVMSRAQIADPEFFKKVREGRLDDINRCIGCNEGCLDGFANLEMPHISCTRNPQVGLEGECPIEPAAEPKTVLIAGGGTAGMMAAKILKQEGHNPIICEASDKLGGALLLGGAIERTSEYRKAIESSARQLERAGVDIRLNTTVTPELIKQIKPDAVFCCLGAVPETPDFAKGKVNVVQARDVLAGKVHVGGKVVVIGANGTGIMAGEFVKLADPERNDVTLINRAIVVGVDLGSARKQAHATILEDESLKQSVSTDVTDIVDGKVIGVRDGETVEFPYDYAILATGCVSKDYADLENACAQLGIGFEVLGDAKEVRRAFEAAAEGFAAARRMNDPEYIKKITK